MIHRQCLVLVDMFSYTTKVVAMWILCRNFIRNTWMHFQVDHYVQDIQAKHQEIVFPSKMEQNMQVPEATKAIGKNRVLIIGYSLTLESKFPMQFWMLFKCLFLGSKVIFFTCQSFLASLMGIMWPNRYLVMWLNSKTSIAKTKLAVKE